MTAYVTIEGQLVSRAVIYVPATGAWFADVDLFDDHELTGRVSLVVGNTTFTGTVDTASSGSFQAQRRVRVVAGAGAWGTLLPAKAYHSDSGILARSVAEDAAREAGEDLGSTFTPRAERVGVDYVRNAGPASRALEDGVGGSSWWVGYDGRTNVGERPASSPAPDAYDVLEYDARTKTATIALDDVGTVVVGATLDSPRLDEPLAVRELEIEIADAVRVTARGGPPRSRGLTALAAIIQRETDAQLFGVWKYRVLSMQGDKVELQAVDRGRGLPDISPISMWPGEAGLHAVLAAGQEVLVQFIGGNRTEPIITHFGGKDGRSWTPTELILVASSTVKIGSANPEDSAARASQCDSRFDDISTALDFLGTYVPASPGPGAGDVTALVTAFKGIWNPSLPVPTPASNVGSNKVKIDP